MNKVIVTGSSGFIGQHVINCLRDLDVELHCFNRHETQQKNNVHSHAVDIFDQHKVTSLFDEIQPTHLLHLAWDVTPGKFWAAKENSAWVNASIQLLTSFYTAGGNRAIFAGTYAEYDWSIPKLSETTTALKPNTLYGECKKMCFEIASRITNTFDKEFAHARIFHPYGPGEHRDKLIPFVITQLLRGKVAQCSDCEIYRDFLYIEDIASALVTVLFSSLRGPVNIASGEGILLKELVLSIGERLGNPELIKFAAPQASPSQAQHLIADTKRLTEELNWKPSVSLEEGLEKTILWWKSNNEV